MNTERIVRIVAGLFILLSLSLGIEASPLFQSQKWLWFNAFVGLNLFQSGFTQFCPLEMILKKLGVQSSCQAPSCH
jgi:disulfide bond formation protein DsbB